MADLANIAASLMEHLCEHSSHGYTQGNRWGDGGTESVTVDGHTFTLATGDRDCSSAVIDVWRHAISITEYAGKLDGATYTGNMKSTFLKSGLFEWKPMSFTAQRGDIYLNEGNHTAMCTSVTPDLLAEFSISENGTIYGNVGDQTGRESRVRAYYDYPWDGILHYTGGGNNGATTPKTSPSSENVTYRVSIDEAGKTWFSECTNFDNSDGDGYAGEFGSPIRYLAINMSGWYQVRTEKNGWIDKVRGYDITDLENGCAGDGSPITGVRCYFETQNPNETGWLGIEYAVHELGGSWLSNVIDTSSPEGDDFAGDTKQIDGFRARLVSV